MPIVALAEAMSQLARILADPDELVRAVGSGRRRGLVPSAERVDLRPVQLKAGPHIQLVTRQGSAVTTRNVAAGADADRAVAELLAEPYGNWHVETPTHTWQVRVTKKGAAAVARTPTSARSVAVRSHDRVKERLIDPDDPLFAVLGAGADKRRQVDAFLRVLAAATVDGPEVSRCVDLGCGNAYLTFAAHRWLRGRFPAVRTVGVEQRADLVTQSEQRAQAAGLEGLSFVAGSIVQAEPFVEPPQVVLALHACDTATDDALARAVRWRAPVILAAPCCHHDVQRQLSEPPYPYGAITRQPILRERFADVLTDALRALVLRTCGYRVDVIEFVDSRHTPRNALIRARYVAAPDAAAEAELAELTHQWRVWPALADRLGLPQPTGLPPGPRP